MDSLLERGMTSWDAKKGDRIDAVAQALRRLYLRTELCPCMQRPECRQCKLDKDSIEAAWNETASPRPEGPQEGGTK